MVLFLDRLSYSWMLVGSMKHAPNFRHGMLLFIRNFVLTPLYGIPAFFYEWFVIPLCIATVLL